MKARFTAQHIRLRLRKSDISQLQAEQAVTTRLSFPGKDLVFRLEMGRAQAPSANFKDGELTVTLPDQQARQWIDSDQVGISHTQRSAGLPDLELLIEKDFPCAHRPMENKADTFRELAPEE
ncbi:DUF7009 family protein [Phaeodactylibacter luteus]|uniref:Uncharacterized protein n=1 Tax=Phaeodactylibacter luteus TaxID=1564516 RepID=A0A5C6RR79_9BACT|nr:hypothetical protein [Phaeodactylibacter luteus]TXB64489.1 hypothetical protein FRY97_07285 [Phaeodactylibacter luteus]